LSRHSNCSPPPPPLSVPWSGTLAALDPVSGGVAPALRPAATRPGTGRRYSSGAPA
jgi:hypothetical protein